VLCARVKITAIALAPLFCSFSTYRDSKQDESARHHPFTPAQQIKKQIAVGTRTCMQSETPSSYTMGNGPSRFSTRFQSKEVMQREGNMNNIQTRVTPTTLQPRMRTVTRTYHRSIRARRGGRIPSRGKGMLLNRDCARRGRSTPSPGKRARKI
jgi:hypothetical protein